MMLINWVCMMIVECVVWFVYVNNLCRMWYVFMW